MNGFVNCAINHIKGYKLAKGHRQHHHQTKSGMATGASYQRATCVQFLWTEYTENNTRNNQAHINWIVHWGNKSSYQLINYIPVRPRGRQANEVPVESRACTWVLVCINMCMLEPFCSTGQQDVNASRSIRGANLIRIIMIYDDLRNAENFTAKFSVWDRERLAGWNGTFECAF